MSLLKSEKVKKIILSLAAMHTVEAPIAYLAASKRGKNPKLYAALTAVFGVFVLIPLLRQPKAEKAASES
ncbi:hypothetical protein [Candidatus Solincola sp.]|jgi:hypothetical protein|nr:DUF4499 domain-containing protein [Actinomycetota bacterium]